MSDSGPAVFLSYASQDAEAVQRLGDALRAAGVEVWFDKNELVGGDAWDQKIRGQIGACALFVPVVSANTQARREGYFRIEWRLAAQRTHAMADGTPFLLPVVIDATRDTDALVPAEFKTVQWTRLPGGETPPAFVARVQKMLAGDVEVTPVSTRPTASRGAPAAGQRPALPKWLRPVFASAIIVIFALALTLRKNAHSSASGSDAAPPVAPPAGVVSAAPEFPRDPDLKRAVQLIYRLDAIAADFTLAEDLVQPLLTARPNDPEVATVAAMVAQEFLTRGFDVLEARVGRVQKLTERAVALAPDNPDALAALGRYLVFLDAQLPRAEELLRRAIALNPDEPRYYRVLVQVLNRIKPAEGAALAGQMVVRFPRDALVQYDVARGYKDRNEVPAMEDAIDRTLAAGPVVNAMIWKSALLLNVHGDVAGMKTWLDRVPERQRTNARYANALSLYGTITGDTDEAIKVLQDLPDDWLNDFEYRGPKTLLLGNLMAAAGRKDQARLQYEAALADIRKAEAARPTDLDLREAEAWVLLGLGRREESRSVWNLLQESLRRPYRARSFSAWWSGPVRAAFLVGEREQAVALLRESATETVIRQSSRQQIAIDPLMAAFRHDPEVIAALADPADTAPRAADLPRTIDDKSVAVLAFANLSDDKANEYFSDGISEELLNVLVKIDGLKVAARTSAFYFKGKDVPVPEIARQLSVAYVVEGSVRKQGGKVRITAQLIKAADGFHVWSDTFTRDLQDIFAVQDEIAGLIARNISPVLVPPKAAANRAVAPEAVQEYLAGNAAYAKAGMANLRDAVAHFERATAAEPKFTAAWIQLASAYTRLGRWGGLPSAQAWRSARGAIDRAQALDPDSPEMLVALGWVLRTAEWDWAGAERAFRRALALRPNQPEMMAGTAVLLFNLGRTDEAFRLGLQAAKLDPLNPGTQIDLALMFFFNGNWPETERSARRALELAPDGTGYHSILAWSLLKQQRYAEAEAEIAREDDPVEKNTAAGLLAVARGRESVVREALGRLEKLAVANPDSVDLQHAMAWLSVGLGDKDRAFSTLEKAYASRDASLAWIRNYADFQPLHADPRWTALLRKMGLAEDQLK